MTPPVRPWIGGILVAAWLLALIVAPVTGAEPGPTLRDPDVDPRSGGRRTTFTFQVTYADPADERPDYVRVRIGGRSHRLFRVGGGHDWDAGVRYRWSGRLSSGTHQVTFLARSHDNVETSLDAGSVKVEVQSTPAPDPTPRADPTAKPKPKPKPDPTAKPRPESRSTPKPRSQPRSTPRPESKPRPRATPKPARTPAPTATPILTAVVPRHELDSDSPDAAPTDAPGSEGALVLAASVVEVDADDHGDGGSAGSVATSADPGPGGPVSRGSGPTWGPLAMLTAALGLDPFDKPVMPLVPTVVTTTGVAAASMALGLFGRRRRDEDQPEPDVVLAAQAAQGVGIGDGVTRGLHDPGDGDGLAGPDELDLDAEALLPRWRRPSLLQARRADPLRTSEVAPRLSFDAGFSGALAGNERRLVRYTVVRLLDAPDELRGNEIGILGDGDEVELLEKQGVYWLVGCPDGGRGWIHQMTLGPSVGQAAAPDAPSASLPAVPETWTMGESDVDDDVLAAYLSSRQRAG